MVTRFLEAKKVINENQKVAKELQDRIVTILDDASASSFETDIGKVTVVRYQRTSVSGSDLAEALYDNEDALSIEMLLDIIAAASTIDTKQLTSTTAKALASTVAKTTDQVYLKATLYEGDDDRHSNE